MKTNEIIITKKIKCLSDKEMINIRGGETAKPLDPIPPPSGG